VRILDLQRRLREIGRIRIGQKVPTSNGKSRPSKLTNFRLTSRDQQVIDAAAQQWGGTAQPWADAPGDGQQWEVYTTADSLPVIVPPGDLAFSQAYAQWTAGGCKVRCDGQWDHLNDKACHCDPENRACEIHTRLSVMLPDLPGLGVWRLDTQGYYAAVELGGVVDICAAHSARGAMLPARLRLEQREVKRPGVQTRKFAVPVLDLDVHPLSLGAGLDAPALPSGNLTPVPAQDGAAAPSIAEQLMQIDEPIERQRRANAAATLPATGLAPRTAIEAHAEVVQDGKQSEVLAAIEKLTEAQQDQLKVWLKEADLPAIRRMNAEQLEAVIGWLMDLSDEGDVPLDSDEMPGSGRR
jgi:hypothetical protein